MNKRAERILFARIAELEALPSLKKRPAPALTGQTFDSVAELVATMDKGVITAYIERLEREIEENRQELSSRIETIKGLRQANDIWIEERYSLQSKITKLREALIKIAFGFGWQGIDACNILGIITGGRPIEAIKKDLAVLSTMPTDKEIK